MQDILNEINSAEEKAEEIIASAKKYADNTAESSQKEILKHKKEIFENADKFVAKAIEEKKLLAKFEIEKLAGECENETKELKEKAESNMDKAVSYILSVL